ncbi:hypothetical protein [Marinobacterium sp. BA1]|uniref:hypothetical protein n=1 Tax=Marinobacterium sp. BA1 TaxID=3138931 RepID=UPI0032E75F54
MNHLNMDAHLIDGDVGDEQHHVHKQCVEPIEQRPATAHYWSAGGAGHVPGWYKVAHDGEWWFWRTDRDCWLHAPCPAGEVLRNLVALPPLDNATYVTGSHYFRLGQYGWEHWESGSKQWTPCDAPNPGSVDRVIHPGLKPNASEIPNSSDHIADAGEMVEGAPAALEAKRQQLQQDHSGDTTKKPSMVDLYPKYYKDFTGVDEVDVYMVHDRFQINDPSGCIHHASKKLLLCGVRTGGKDMATEIKEARDTLTRKLQLMGVEK